MSRRTANAEPPSTCTEYLPAKGERAERKRIPGRFAEIAFRWAASSAVSRDGMQRNVFVASRTDSGRDISGRDCPGKRSPSDEKRVACGSGATQINDFMSARGIPIAKGDTRPRPFRSLLRAALRVAHSSAFVFPFLPRLPPRGRAGSREQPPSMLAF